MKRIYLLSTLLIFIYSSVFAQEPGKLKNRHFKTWITLNSDPIKVEGELYEIDDSSLSVKSLYLDYKSTTIKPTKINYRNIARIDLRSAHSVGNGTWIGALGGICLGVIIGLNSESDPNKLNLFSNKQLAVMDGIGIGIVGAGIGAFLGSIKIQIPINGKVENFIQNKMKLRRYSYKK